MHREYFYVLVLLTTLIASSMAYNIEQPLLQLFANNTFSLSIEDDPDIKWVQFNVNINKEFLAFEEPQYNCTVAIPSQRSWSCEFEKQLLDEDIVYTWMLVKHNHLIYRARQNPFSVGALRRGEGNYILTTTTTTWSPLDADDAITAPTNQPAPTVSGVNGSVPNHVCDSTITVLRNSKKICRNQLIFEDNFDQFNNEYWTNEIRIPTTQLDSEFVIYNGSVVANNGILKITASISDYGINTAYDLGERCTSNNINECLFEKKLHHFLPPITSGRINSAKYFNFKYGRIEIRAKVPKGDWLFPLIALQPSSNEYGPNPFANGEMRVAFVRGNKDLRWNDVNIGGKRLFGGPIFSLLAKDRHQFMSNITLVQANGGGGIKEHFGDKFHIYSLTWKTNELLLSVDGSEYGKIPIDFKNSVSMSSWRNGAPNVPLDQMFYITLGLAAGGHGDFPENIQNKPWENTDPKAIKNFYKQHNIWLETWTQPSLEVDYVRVYAI